MEIEIGYGEALQFGVKQGVYTRRGSLSELEQLQQLVAELEEERDAAIARLSEERDIWDRMLGDAADKFAHLERELDDCLYVLDALWNKQSNKDVTQKWVEILIRSRRVIGASSAEDSCQQSTE